jgi:hypothetical protein
MVYYTVLGPIGLNLQPGAPAPFPTRQQGASQLPQPTYGYGNPADNTILRNTIRIRNITIQVYRTTPVAADSYAASGSTARDETSNLDSLGTRFNNKETVEENTSAV